ncbi:DNA-directed RNA polymerase subunit beta [Lentibacillus persicus]|uniref:DNA-directed RNA polymerase subunit beta n=1 Tax=Lentibacillus persicus TaxID=640948 RepID=A0A1I1XSS8_9BACI|nr:DNA-directed RNA polymerase subunit beta [Lentibacillus persicus]SFE10324.1 DNA-directed RNA polymerase subunit beta [Lentibacillus persicus]
MPTDEKEKTTSRENSQQTETKDARPQQEETPDKATRQEQKKQQKREKRENKKPRRRIFPIWLRIIVVLLLSAIALASGLIVGYGVIGDGNPMEALEWETWQHIIDIVVKER